MLRLSGHPEAPGTGAGAGLAQAVKATKDNARVTARKTNSASFFIDLSPKIL
jgi:hypothetical protein